MPLKQNGPCVMPLTHGPREKLLAKSSGPKNSLQPDPRQISSAIHEMRLRHLLGRLDEAADSLEYLQFDEHAEALLDVEAALAEASKWIAEALNELRDASQAADLAGTGGRS
jgi:hypothetical protein